MSRRAAERHARRMEVRFWKRNSPHQHSGFTIDVSKTGIFLGTNVSFEPEERIRLELVDRDRSFIVEGQVSRVHRVSLALRHIEQPGVGVRFLTPAELVGEMLGSGRPKSGSGQIPRPRFDGSAAIRPPVQAAPAAAEEPQPAPAPAVPAVSPERVVTVEFVDRASFLSVYHRDIASGGLFVSSEDPAPMDQIVTIELRPPVHTEHPLRFEARVVQRFDAPPAGGRGGSPGMGVQFLDPDRVRAALAPIVVELRR